MSHKTREVKYIECDGCGYSISTDVRFTTLDFAWENPEKKRSGKMVFHFHAAGKDQDCLRYWLLGTGIFERSLHENTMLTEDDIQHILRTVKWRDKVSV